MNIKIMTLALCAAFALNSCGGAENGNAPAQKSEAELKAEAEAKEKAEAEAKAKAEADAKAAAEAKAKAEAEAKAQAEAEAKAEYEREYGDYMVDNYYNYGISCLFFDLPDANGEGYGAMGWNSVNLFKYKIADDGVLKIDLGKKMYSYYHKSYSSSWPADTYKPLGNGDFYWKYKTEDKGAKAEVTFYNRGLEFYNRNSGESFNLPKVYNEEKYQSVLAIIRACKDNFQENFDK